MYAQKRKLSRVWTILLVAVGLVVLLVLSYAVWAVTALYRYVACGAGDYSIELPHGYEIVRIYSGNVSLFKHHGTVLGPNITGYSIVEPYLIGLVEAAAKEPPWGGKLGYFILDTRTGEVKWWSKEQEWLDALRERDVAVPPRLERPRNPRVSH